MAKLKDLPIQEQEYYIKVCSVCGKVYHKALKKCPACGSEDHRILEKQFELEVAR
jgi:rRNA maturation endonuclease Nob1